MKVIIAEKPSLGRTIASALGVYDKCDGYLTNGEITVTYAFGHLLELKDMDAYFGHKVPWGENLPFYPDTFEFDLKKMKSFVQEMQIVKVRLLFGLS